MIVLFCFFFCVEDAGGAFAFDGDTNGALALLDDVELFFVLEVSLCFVLRFFFAPTVVVSSSASDRFFFRRCFHFF